MFGLEPSHYFELTLWRGRTGPDTLNTVMDFSQRYGHLYIGATIALAAIIPAP